MANIKFKSRIFLILLFISIFSCKDNTLNPKFEPEIINQADAFEFQATAVENVSQSLSYDWNNTGTMANVNQSSSISSGTATITIQDATGQILYGRDLKENGTFQTNAGTSGSWKITVTLSKINGTLNFRAEKRTP